MKNFTRNPEEKEAMSDTKDTSADGLVRQKISGWLRAWNLIMDHASVVVTVVAIVLGIVLGFLLVEFYDEKGEKLSLRDTSYVGYLGELILNMFECLVIPLMCSSIITATASLDQELTQRIGLMAVVTMVVLNATASIVTVLLCFIIKPGTNYVAGTSNATMTPPSTTAGQRMSVDYLLDLVRNLFPPNYIQALLELVETVVPQSNGTGSGIKYKYIRSTNTLGMTLMSVAIGMAISRIGVYGHCVIAFCQSLIKFLTLIIDALQWVAPIMVISLIASAITPSGIKPAEIFSDLGPAIGSVLLAIIICTLLGAGAYWAYKRRFPVSFSQAILPAVLTAVGNTSSLITLPVTLSCLDDIGVNPRSSRFLVPVASVWAWGSTIYMAAGLVFCAQYNAKLKGESPPAWDKVWRYSLAAFFGGSSALPVPQGGVTALQYFLPTVGLKYDLIVPLASIDYVLDPFLSGMNVLGGAIVATIVNDLNRSQLERLESYEKDLQMVATLVRLNQALETTLRDEEGEAEAETETETEKEAEDHYDDQDEHPKDPDSASKSSSKSLKKRRRRPRMMGTTVVNRLLDKALLEHRARSGRGSLTRSHTKLRGILRRSGTSLNKAKGSKGKGKKKKKRKIASSSTLKLLGKKGPKSKKIGSKSSKTSSHLSGNEEASGTAPDGAPPSPEEATTYHEESESRRGSGISTVQTTEEAAPSTT